ncbi:MAG TPA: serine/threonine-protein kinase [Gemmatimonadales bacterium]|nr:serine/threonine-protein kinase [Gemmatimonadales bacterium]
MSTDGRWTRLMELFDQAREIPPAQRDAWMTEACGGDEELRRELSCMLEADTGSLGILDRALAMPYADDLPVLAGELAGRYELAHELGEGGMARVFLATERKHGRAVVLKILKPDVARHFGRERFYREARILAQLAHPHIVGLIDSGEAAGHLYYVMPYLEGETLRDRLKRVGQLPVPMAVSVLRDVADALRHAHQAGVVHRDLKPSNIFLVGDHAFLLDFGIAKMLEPEPGQDPPTESGAAIGTPAYMAPEQRVGDPMLDHRADLYTWGVVAYESLLGQLPDHHILPLSAGDIVDRRPDVPPALARLIAECLSPAAEDRPADADRLVRGLEGRMSAAVRAIPATPEGSRRTRLAVALTGLAAFAVIAGTLTWRSQARDDAALRAPIAVSAFSNETGDPNLDTWGRLAGDWITEGLNGLDALAVVPWTTSLKASELIGERRSAARPVDPVAVLREETGAQTVITGSYYRVGDSLRFHAEVADAKAGRVLATLPPVTVPVSTPEAGISELRQRVMGMVAASLNTGVSKVANLGRRPPTYEAYQAFDKGLTLSRSQEYEAALPQFLRAFALDTQFVGAILSAATASWNAGNPALMDSLIKELRKREGALSDLQRIRLEGMEARIAGDGQAELKALRRAAVLSPNSQAVYNLADVALNTDRPAEALTALESLDPDRGEMRGWAPYWFDLAHVYHLLGRHDAELRAARELRRRYPDRRAGLVFEVRALAAVGDTAGVDRLLAEGQLLPPNTYWSQGAALTVAGEELQAHGFGQTGWRYLTQAVSWLDHQLALASGDRSHRYWLASALYDLGDWRRSHAVSRDLAREFPNRLDYRVLATVAAARLHLREADTLPTTLPHERGALAMLKARIATIRGQREAALGFYREATEHGLNGLAWIHGSAAYDLFLLGEARRQLPLSLRSGLPEP